MRTLRDRTAVITGAASGIGRALAEVLAAEGCRLALVDRDADGLAATRDRLASVPVSLHVLSVADREALRALPEAVLAEHGAVHVLINNAGITTLATLEEMTEAELDRVLDVNLRAVIDGCRFFLPALRAVPEAHIVNLSSMAAFTGMPFQTAYCATKAGVKGFTEALRAELSGSTIGVTGVYPGAVGTSIMASATGPHAAAVDRLGALLRDHAYPASRAARRIVAGVRANRAAVRIGAQSWLLDWSVRVAPWLVRGTMALIARQGRKMLESD